MASPAILKIDVIADATKAAAALSKVGDETQKTGSKWASMGKTLATGVAGAAILEFGKSSFEAAQESEVATKRLQAVFKSMGDETGRAAKQAENYAGALSKKIGVDDEAIMASQALLATFSNVSNETGRNAGIFDRATAAAADLAAAGFGSLDTNAKQLGKALQDPIKGTTALAKSGVTFTAQQKEQIAAMVASGDTLGAQKIILGEVEKQVKGTAAATATGGDKMAVAFDSVQESVGSALLPVMQKLAPILVKVAEFIAENVNWLAPLAAGILVVVAAQWAWNAAMAANPLTLIVIAIAAVVAGIILLVKNWDTVTAAFKAAFSWIADNWPLLLTILLGPFGFALQWVIQNWDKVSNAVGAVIDWIKANWPLLLAILTGPIGLAILAIVKNFDTIKNAALSVRDFVVAAFTTVVQFFQGIPDILGRAFGGLADILKAPFKAAFNAIARFWNSTVGSLSFSVPGWVPGIGGKGFDVPDIPTLATGGRVLRTGMALVHAGETFSGVGNTSSSSGGGDVTIVVNAGGLGADAPAIQRAVANALRGYTARNGPLNIPIRAGG